MGGKMAEKDILKNVLNNKKNNFPHFINSRL
jgi:hypothetical protein